jgi:hypothetical protein
MENNWYLYRHLKPCGEVFYIGIGKTKNFKRAFEKQQRSNWWTSTIRKYPEYEVEILTTGLTKEEACDLEIILISWYKRKDCCDGSLVNMTDGGEGASGNICSIETRKKISEANKKVVRTKEWGENISKGKQNISEDTRRKIGEKSKGRQANKGNKHTEETKLMIGKKSKGRVPTNRRPIIDTVTKIIYSCKRIAAEALGIKERTLKAKLLNHITNDTNLRYLSDVDIDRSQQCKNY